jgi:hypothetical protein
VSEFFQVPQEQNFLSFFVFAQNDNFGFSFDIDHEVEDKLQISGPKRELFVPLNGILVGGIDIVIDFL